MDDWVRFYRLILTAQYRCKFIVEFDPRLLPKLLDALGIHSAQELVASLRGTDG